MRIVSERFQLPESVQKLIRSSTCVAFVGSGPSIGAYYSWPELVNRLCEQCGSDIRVTRDSPSDAFLDAAESAKRSNEERYYEVLGEHFGRAADHASLLYDVLLILPFGCYLTPNLDPILALKGRTASRKCDSQIRSYPSLDRKAMNRTINYLHGMIPEGRMPERGTIVLARSEFEEAYAANSNLLNFLIPTLENDPILFIGCRLHEPVMGQVFAICKAHQQRRQELIIKQGRVSTPPPRYILLPEPEIKTDISGEVNAQDADDQKTKETDYYKGMGIEVVWYPSAGGDHSALRFALDSVAELPDTVPTHDWGGGSAYVG
jgi:hypothetical protein